MFGKLLSLSLKYTLFIRLPLFLALFFWARPSDAVNRGPWRILVLQSYHADFAWTSDIMQGIHTVFDGQEQLVEYYIEYMDTKRFPQPLHGKELDLLQEHLTEKYRETLPQVIISVDDDALYFLMDRRETIFPHIPIVFCGVNNPVDETKIGGSTLITGVMEVLDRRETIDAAISLHPEARKLAIITDTTTNGIGNRNILKELAKEYAGRLAFVFLDEEGTGVSLDELRGRLSRLDDDALVYYADFFRDTNGFLDQATVIPLLSMQSSRPIYSPYSFIFGFGVVGGKLNSALFQGEAAAQMALRILKGTDPSQIPVIKESINRFMFDHRQMDRWGIQEKNLPAGSIVMHRAVNIFEVYRKTVIAALLVFITLISVIAALIVNIHRRKHAEERIDKLASVVEYSDDMIVVKDLDLRVAATNMAFVNASGHRSLEDLIGKTDAEIFGVDPETEPVHTSMADERKAQLLPPGEYILREEPFVLPSGEVRYLLTKKYPIFNGQGRLIGTGNISRDITERKLNEEALRESEEKHRTILQTAMDGFFITDMQGRLMEVNETYCRMSGYSKQELLTMRVSDLEVIETPDEIARRILKIRAHFMDRFETRHRRKGGTIFDIDASIQYQPIEGGRIVAFMRDITERKQAEEERKKLQLQLVQAQKMESVGRLAGGVAHDFNNMLSVILGYTEIVMDNVSPEGPLFIELQEIRKAAERSADLTRQLLAFARKQTIAPSVLSLNETVEGMLKMLRRLIGEDIDLVWQPATGLWKVNMDPSQIDQILANLCLNARDSISGVGRVLIETENWSMEEGDCEGGDSFRPGDYVRLSISDNGRGMEKEILDHVFEPFFTTKEIGKGTGLGLATIYGIVQQNKGFVNVYSEPGQGSTFSIYLPRYSEEVEKTMVYETPENPKGGWETILLVEDEPAIMKMTQALLKNMGYTVLAANTPNEALHLAKTHTGQIHLLITDVVMPEMNGRDLSRSLLAILPHLKQLFMSGYTADVIAHHGMLDEGLNFIQKPFSRKQLSEKVRMALTNTSIDTY